MKYFFVMLILMSSVLEAQTKFEDITSNLNLTNSQMAEGWGSGVSAEDFDGDGDIDLAICSDMSSLSKILVNQGDGTFQEIHFNLNFHSRTALWIDYNGDHRLDLLFIGDCLRADESCNRIIALFEQNEGGAFVESTERAGLALSFNNNTTVFGGAAAADINEDGFLDVLIVYSDKVSSLLESRGDGTFNVIEDYFVQGSGRKNWTPVLFDLNRDGWIDYYQASDIAVPNQFWSHTGDLNFKESAEQIGIAYAAEDMGIAIGDYDNDSDLDLLVSNIQLKDLDRGNVLFRNDNFIFSNESKSAGIYKGGWTWGITFMDGNNDGLLDIASTNGWDTYGYDSSRFWLNNGDATFTDVSDEVQFNDTLFATTLIAFDLERDGDLDMVQTLKAENHSIGYRVLRNNLVDNDNQNFLVVQPRMSGANHWAIGSLVKIKTSNGEQIRPITAGISYFGQEPAEAFFGLGSLNQVDEIEITWPGGGRSIVQNVSVNQVIVIQDDDAIHPPKNPNLSIEPKRVTLTWEASSTLETSYVIEKSESVSFSSFIQKEVPSTEKKFLDEEVEIGKTYYYRVRAKGLNEESRSSIHIMAEIKDDIPSPSNVMGKNLSSTSAKLSWEDMYEDEDGYQIQRSAQINFSSFIEFNIGPNDEFFIDENLEPNSIYYYRIRALRGKYFSNFSEIVSVDLSIKVLSLKNNQYIEVSPNPSSEFIRIQNISSMVDNLKLLDLNGKLILQVSPKLKELMINLPLQEGIYLLRIELLNGNVGVYKIVKK